MLTAGNIALAIAVGLAAAVCATLLVGRAYADLSTGAAKAKMRHERREAAKSRREGALGDPKMRKIADRLADIHPLSETEEAKFRAEIAKAGLSLDPSTVNGFRFAFAIGFGAVALLLGGALARNPVAAVALAAYFGAMGFALPKYKVRKAGKRRSERIEAQMSDALELMSITVKAGYPLQRSIRLVSTSCDSELAEEFAQVDREINYLGMSTEQALGRFMERTDSPTAHSFATSVIQADKQGTSVSRVLDAQARLAREEHFAALEEKVNQVPNKMVPVFFLFFMPVIIILAIVPPVYNSVTAIMGSM